MYSPTIKEQRVAFTLVLSLCLSAILLLTRRSSAQPESQLKTSSLKVAGLRDSVTIRRDERGIPYIEAANEEDLFLALGYVVASDRLWQMDLMRRTACGELAEIFGRAVLEEDKRVRAFGFAVLAEQMVSRVSSQMRAALEAYARGVNAFTESLDVKSLPPEFSILQYKPRRWRPADSLVIGKLFAETLTTTWQTDVMRAALANLSQDRREALLPSTSPLDVIMVGSDNVGGGKAASHQPTSYMRHEEVGIEMLRTVSEVTVTMRRSLERIGLYAEDLAASNNWVVNGSHSVTGKPLVANDPHLAASAPSIWYMVHLSAPGVRVAGVTVAGSPGVIIGHNERIAWGITNVEADVQDLYIEKFDKNNPRRYMTPTGWREADVRREEIKARKNPLNPETETVEYEVMVTRHGPIIFEKEAVRYALAWPALDPTTIELEAYYWINRARNWQEFCVALSRYTGFPLNYVYADVDRHIGYWAAGRYPIRKTGQGTVPYDGTSDAGDWTGYIPAELTPRVYDPASGIIVTANNRITGLDYRYYITHNWAAPYRARRIYDLLTARAKSTVDDFRAIQADVYSYPDAIFTAEVVKLGQPLAASSPEWGEMFSAFAGWNAMMSAESCLMPISFMMRDAFKRRILNGALGVELARRYAWANSDTFFDHIITARPREWLPKEFDSYESLLLACYKEALETLTKRLGPDRSRWAWGRLLQARFPHPLANAPLIGGRFAIAPIPQNGGGPTVNRAGFVSMRYIADLSNWDNTRQGIQPGESGNPASLHWKDQLADWQAAAPRKFPFSKDAIASAAKEVLVLLAPRAGPTNPQ